MSEKKYTAQMMRDAADTMDECLMEMEDGNSMYWRDDHMTSEDWKAMLRQAADAEEELAQLKARLTAVVKECKRINDETFERSINKVVAYKTRVDVASDAICCAILRAARGESETENK